MKAHSIKIPISTNDQDGAPNPIDLSSATSLLVPGDEQVGESRLQVDYLLVPDTKSYHPIQRLIVIVPSGELDERWLGLQISKIALPRRLRIIFIATAINSERDRALRRRIATLTSLVKDRHTKPSTRLVFHENWIKAVKKVWQEGDLLVCIEGHRTPTFPFRRKKLAPHLVATLGVPVYVLTGIYIGDEPMQWNRGRELLIWVLAIAMIVLFGFLQFFIDRTFGKSVATLLFFLSVVVEILLLWKLNSLG